MIPVGWPERRQKQAIRFGSQTTTSGMGSGLKAGFR